MAHGSEQWEALNEKYHLLEQVEEHSFATITALEINQAQADYPALKFEPRLLTHFDNARQLPNLFTDNDLSILPVERGSYVIGRFNTFKTTPSNFSEMEVRTLPRLVELETLREEMLTNEAMGLNYALANGIIENFIEEELTATIAGRQSGGIWSYKIKSRNNYLDLQVRNPQIEVDGGYEGYKNIVLIEAKNTLVSQFNLRQLYFPYRTWKEKSKKSIRTVFATFDNGEVYLHEYVFPEYDVFSGMRTRSVRYQISDELISKDRVELLLKNTYVRPNGSRVSFPQANAIFRIISLIEYLALKGEATRQEISDDYGFHIRQSGYYGEAVEYLGFAEKIRGGFKTNQSGKYFANSPVRLRNLLIITSLCKKSVFRETLELCMLWDRVPEEYEVIEIIRKNVPDINYTTATRRASTVRSWMKWAVSVIR